jgi:ATP-dependent helicase/DNAse subunit B
VELADELKAMRQYVPAPAVESHATVEQVQAWRSTAAALKAFDQAVEAAALAFGGAYTSLVEFWSSVETVLSAEKLRVNDGRRNVVNVLDVFEARQWELPVAFVCGLSERVFPQYQRENPLFRDEERRKAKLPTSDDRQWEERFLFDLAVTRATGETVLSYPRYNERGEASLRSFYLEEEGTTMTGPRILPRPDALPRPPLGPAPNVRPTSLSASSIDSFLQCPFQYFGRKTLRLRPRPPKPRERLNVLLQGQIIHAAIASAAFDEAFDNACAEHNIPATYRKEAVRLELLRHYEALLADTQWTLPWESVAEQQFEMMLTPDLRVRGRIDRLYTSPRGETIVVDYKYSTAATLKDRMSGDSVQGGLYLLAAEQAFGLTPAGMLYCGLKKKVNWQGWHAIRDLAVGDWTTSSVLREMMADARRTAVETFAQIAEGRREVRPADRKKCEYCEFRDICRDRASAAALEAEA